MTARIAACLAAAATVGAGFFPAATVLHARAAGPATCLASGNMDFNPPLNTRIGTGYAFTFNGVASCVGLVGGAVDVLTSGAMNGQGDCPSGGLGGAGGGTVATCLSVLNGGSVVQVANFGMVSPLGACAGTWLQIGTVFEAECGVDGVGILTFTGVFVPNPLFQAPIATVSYDGVLAATL